MGLRQLSAPLRPGSSRAAGSGQFRDPLLADPRALRLQPHPYTIALFNATAAQQGIAGQGRLAALAAQLQAINRAFQPDVVIATGENKLLPLAFPHARCLWIEQAPFPRRKRRDRVYLDACSDQLGSVLEQAGERILALELSSTHLAQVEAPGR